MSYYGKFKTSTKLDRIKHGKANFILQAQSGLPPAFVKFYWNTPKFICLHIVYDCFHAAMAQLGSCNQDCMA